MTRFVVALDFATWRWHQHPHVALRGTPEEGVLVSAVCSG